MYFKVQYIHTAHTVQQGTYIRKVLSSCVNFVYCNGSRSKQRFLPLPGHWEHCLCYCSAQKSAYTFRVNEILTWILVELNQLLQ